MRRLPSIVFGVAVLVLVAAATAAADPPSAPPSEAGMITTSTPVGLPPPPTLVNYATSTPAGLIPTSTPVTSHGSQAPIVCGSGYYCFWTSTNYVGARGYVNNDRPNWYSMPQSRCPNGTWADCAESNYNNGIYDQVNSYTATNYLGTGGYTCRQTGGNLVPTFFQKIESNLWVAGC